MSYNVNAQAHREQARDWQRVQAGYDAVTQGYNLIAVDSGGKLAIQYADLFGAYKVSDTDALNPIRYYGYLNAEGAWLIMKEDSDAQSFRFAKGTSAYVTAWSNRASLGYDYFDAIF